MLFLYINFVSKCKIGKFLMSIYIHILSN